MKNKNKKRILFQDTAESPDIPSRYSKNLPRAVSVWAQGYIHLFP